MDLSFLQDQVNLLTSEQEDMDSFIVPSNYAEIEMLLTKPSVKEMLALKKYNSKGHSDFREFCTYQLKSDCQRVNGNSCQKVQYITFPHFYFADQWKFSLINAFIYLILLTISI